MIRDGVFGAAIALTIAFSGSAALAGCSVATVAGADTMINPAGRIDQALADAAIRAEVNYYRCKAGRSALGPSSGLAKVAATHAKWMAKALSVSHRSQVAGQSTLKARMSTSGVRYKVAAENIGMVHRFAIEGAGFKIKGSCQFETNGGQKIGAHSYRSLAKQIVAYWMGSKEHKANILRSGTKVTGSGVSFAANTQYCGQFYVSQGFAG